MRLEPVLDEDVVAELVLGGDPSGVAPGAGRDEEGAVGDEHAEGGERDGAQQEQVHQLPLAHVRDAVGGDAAGHACDVPRDALPAEAQALDGLAQRACTGPAELRTNMFSASITNRLSRAPKLQHQNGTQEEKKRPGIHREEKIKRSDSGRKKGGMVTWVGLEAVESAVEAMVAGCYRAERTIDRAS